MVLETLKERKDYAPAKAPMNLRTLIVEFVVFLQCNNSFFGVVLLGCPIPETCVVMIRSFQ